MFLDHADRRMVYAFIFASVSLVAASIAYLPGIAGPFIFDDFPNLSPLGASGGINSLQELAQFLNTGFSGPTGRPVSLLSFLIESNTWPADPEPFKRNNILFHLIVALLLAWLGNILALEILKNKKYKLLTVLPLLCMAWWVLHPLWVSTVLYVVQRMAILSALFTLLSIILYLKARQSLFRAGDVRYISSIFLLFFSGVSALLAVLSKENAAVIPIIVLVIEWVLRSRSETHSNTCQKVIIGFLCVSTFFVVLAVLNSGIANWNVYDSRREFSGSERFWTQGRVLWLYIIDIIVPKISTAGLFTEVEVSKGPFSPISGIIGWLSIAAIMAVSAFYIRRLPFLFLAVWLFFVCHIIESTVIPLELYFEHRNYLPAAFLSLGMFELFRGSSFNYKIVLAGVLSAILLMSLFLAARAEIWSSYPSMIKAWVNKAPGSIRANLEASRVFQEEGDIATSIKYLEVAETLEPNSAHVALWRLFLVCRLGGQPTQAFIEGVGEALATAKSSGTVMQFLGYLSEGTACNFLDPKVVERLLASYKHSLQIGDRRSAARIDMLVGIVRSRDGNPERALESFRSGIEVLRSADSALLAISWLARNGHSRDALKLLNEVEQMLRSGLLISEGRNYLSEIDSLRAAIVDDIKAITEKKDQE